MDRIEIDVADVAGTEWLAAECAPRLAGPAVVALEGTLGAGKTRFVQALATALGTPPGLVTSPTFVLVQEYPGRVPLFHFDAYRLRDDDEFLALGAEEMFERPGICLIEWASRVAACLPPHRLEIRIQVTGPTARRFEIISHGERFDTLIADLRRRGAGGERTNPRE